MTSINNVTNEILRALRLYTNEVADKVEDIKQEVAEDTVSNLKQTSPKKTGKYAKSWKVTKQGTKYIVHAKAPYYRLTHLLERGHAKVNGGRVPGKVHIAPAEEKAIRDYLEKVERELRQ